MTVLDREPHGALPYPRLQGVPGAAGHFLGQAEEDLEGRDFGHPLVACGGIHRSAHR